MIARRRPDRLSTTRFRRTAAAGLATAGVAAMTFTVVPAAAADSGSAPAHARNASAAAWDLPASGIPGQHPAVLAQPERAETPGKAEKAEKGEKADGAEKAGNESPSYPDNLDGWIREALAVMDENGIPGTYDGLHRNIIRESSGDPDAINLWDINAQNGTPSIGLLQVIQPTFDAYHVPGTPDDIYDPVANLVAAANYAWDRYGTIDNVDGPY